MVEQSFLTVEEYNTAELKAVSELSNIIVEAYQPITFHDTGYPTRVLSEDELWKYVDVMHSLRFETDFTDLIGGHLTKDEFELLKDLTEMVYHFSNSRFQKKIIARASVLRMLNVFRHIKYIFSDTSAKIFEIGPGCGYLGAMVILNGYCYAATDVTQAFYMYQNHLWNFITGGKVTELARESVNNKQFGDPSNGYVTHVPWWEFV